MENNIFTYLRWRGDLSFEVSVFNEVDALILSTLSYVYFHRISKKVISKKGVTLAFLAEKLRQFSEEEKKDLFRKEEDESLIYSCGESLRFSKVTLFSYLDFFDKEKTIQFAAMTYRLGNNLPLYVCFRGTDSRITGWKEDLQLSFSIVPAQQIAALYLHKLMRNTTSDVMVGGHSKGGNLASYACAKLSDKNFARVNTIFNQDGPGFDVELVNNQNFNRLQEKLLTYLPSQAIIGMCMEQCGSRTIIVSSTKSGIYQHEPYHWQVATTELVHLEELSDSSKKLKSLLDQWHSSLSVEQRKSFIHSLSDLIDATDSETIYDLTPLTFLRKLQDLYTTYSQMDSTTKDTFFLAFKKLLEAGNHFLPWKNK